MRYHVVALTPAGHREVLCIVHGSGGLTIAGPSALRALEFRIEHAGETRPSRPFDDGTVPIYVVHHARGCICATASLVGAKVREATEAELEQFSERCRAHRASPDFERAAYDGGGAVDLDTAIDMSERLDLWDVTGFARLASMNPHTAPSVEASSACDA